MNQHLNIDPEQTAADIADDIDEQIENALDAKQLLDSADKIFYETELMNGELRYQTADIKLQTHGPELTIDLRRGQLLKGPGRDEWTRSRLHQYTLDRIANAAYRRHKEEIQGGDE